MGKRILNIGCGNDTYGTDFVDLYPSREEVKRVDLEKEKLPFKKNSFEEIYAECVFEHLKNPRDFLKDCKRVLKKQGKLILITDNAAHYKYHISLFKKAFYAHNGGYEKKGRIGGGTGKGSEDKHYALFTPNHLKNFLEDLGFFIGEIKYEFGYNRKNIHKIIDLVVSFLSKRLIFPRIKVVAIKK